MFSCSKSATPAPAAVATAGFTCKINGVAFKADSASYNGNSTQTFILAYKGASIAFEINLAGITATTYPIAMGTNDFIYWPSANYSGGTNGSIIITTYSTTANQLTGTFGTINTAGPGGSFVISDGVFTKIPKH